MRFWFLLLPFFVMAQTGEQLYIQKGCYGCHGTNGNGGGNYPNLQGKKYTYLKTKLQNLRTGKTQTPTSSIMIPFAKDLSDEQMELILKFLTAPAKPKVQQKYRQESFDSGS